jgi:hypothetical protein
VTGLKRPFHRILLELDSQTFSRDEEKNLSGFSNFDVCLIEYQDTEVRQLEPAFIFF